MVKIYEQAKDINVANTIIYTKNNKAFKDVACETQYTKSELKEAFIKGSVIDIQPGAYYNKYRVQTKPSAFCETYDHKGCVEFGVPHIRRNEYQSYVYEEAENVTNIGPITTVQAAPDQFALYVGEAETVSAEDMGIEFGEGTLLYSVLSELGDAVKTISFDVEGFSSSNHICLSCGEDLSEGVLYSSYTRISITTTGNVLRVYVKDTAFVGMYIKNLQVELGSEATPYEAPTDADFEDISYAESAPDA